MRVLLILPYEHWRFWQCAPLDYSMWGCKFESLSLKSFECYTVIAENVSAFKTNMDTIRIYKYIIVFLHLYASNINLPSIHEDTKTQNLTKSECKGKMYVYFRVKYVNFNYV